eukprot:scaffold78676_cov19-Tisochrysis_lutea.AAC.2
MHPCRGLHTSQVQRQRFSSGCNASITTSLPVAPCTFSACPFFQFHRDDQGDASDSTACSQVFSVLGFKLPFYSSPTLLLSPALSVRVLWHLCQVRPDVIHVSTPGLMVGAAGMQACLQLCSVRGSLFHNLVVVHILASTDAVHRHEHDEKVSFPVPSCLLLVIGKRMFQTS